MTMIHEKKYLLNLIYSFAVVPIPLNILHFEQEKYLQRNFFFRDIIMDLKWRLRLRLYFYNIYVLSFILANIIFIKKKSNYEGLHSAVPSKSHAGSAAIVFSPVVLMKRHKRFGYWRHLRYYRSSDRVQFHFHLSRLFELSCTLLFLIDRQDVLYRLVNIYFSHSLLHVMQFETLVHIEQLFLKVYICLKLELVLET
ncbi:hypothetical protein AGLY_007710 [Aphis glycines]|uniref:Uncharacterized protein n=1 Tax=Aphis glycines TaxID=307491 RepID=A0A6G0TMV2_APHGL|nr:hypothetical protein AGLY_007710 [Aphis glycines]